MEQIANNPRPGLFTVGHSNQPQEGFISLLKRNEIQVLVDVRSYPYSKYVPHFNKENLAGALKAQRIKYLYMGKELGGRPDEDEFYDEEGHVLYYRLAESPVFLNGIERLEKGIREYRVAILCSEENPAVCHRHLLVGRVMGQRGTKIRHIRGDGALQFDADLPAAGNEQRSLFDFPEDNTWKSLRPVSRRKQPANSLGSFEEVESSDSSVSD
jgi:uncharacterized protein (DUF488 family)